MPRATDRKDFYARARACLLPALSVLAVSAGQAEELPATTHPHADPAGWMPIPLIGEDIRAAGEPYGGEGGQWVRSIGIDAVDGTFAIYGIDVAGQLRSLDGGQTWEPSNIGYTPRGAGAIAIDPHFPDRVVVLGINSVPTGKNGLYISEDRAASWEHVLPIEMSGIHDIREQLTFDRATRDDAAGLTRDVYWSRLAKDKPIWGSVEPDPSLYRSPDGGRNWSRLPDTAHVAGGVLRDDPHTAGRLLTTGEGGLYVTEDRAATWTKTKAGDFTGLDVSLARPGEVWLTDAQHVYRSSDGGLTFETLAASETLGKSGYTLRGVEVSPADPDRLLLWRQDDDGWDWTWHVSHDAGATWAATQHVDDKVFLPRNERQGVFAWHPTDPDVVLATGGDWPTRSTDGGKTFHWSARGFYGLLVGGTFQFNPNHPDTVFFSSQDYNGALTRDGGRNWDYINVTGYSWGGFTYGGYAADPDRLFVARSGDWGANRVLSVSRDGGQTWDLNEDVVYSDSHTAREGNAGPDEPPYGYRIAYASVENPEVWFFGGYRSTDAGYSWDLMADCDGVFGHAVGDRGTLVGMNYDPTTQRTRLVVSEDDGATWQVLSEAPGAPNDVAYDAVNRIAYIASGGDLYRHRLEGDTGREKLDPPRDQFNSRRVRSVALDPVDPTIVYAAQNKDVYAASVAAMRSFDGGDTWEVLTRQEPLDGTGLDGGREAYFVRVHPTTREPWFMTGCYGNWRYAAPAPGTAPAPGSRTGPTGD